MARIAGRSVRGSSHVKDGRPCQDAVLFWPESGSFADDDICILVIADGHGSARSPNSDIGASFATEIGLKWLKDFSASFPDCSTPALIRNARDHLAHGIVRDWSERVLAREAGQPHPDGDGPAPGTAPSVHDVLQKYGSTLIGILVAPKYILYMQLGDGDVMTYSPGGEVIRPIPDDDSLMANETTSLCSRAAWSEFRVAVTSRSTDLPVLILASTDGYSNSFTSRSEFEKLCPDYFAMVASNEWETIVNNLEAWLVQTSEEGSGDDISLGMIFLPGPPLKSIGNRPDEKGCDNQCC
ncbi:MAG: PP2C family serine/threonine-protein phosphatase [Myxococcota bacterium]|jgi:hypothetical protein